MTVSPPFDNSFARMPDRFFVRTMPTRVSAPRLIKLNIALADSLGLDAGWLTGEHGVAMLSGNGLPGGAEPVATAYAGHQFGSFVPQLGDGRAILLGEVIDRDGMRRDIQLKGSGPTPFSRRGDGRAALGPVLREYVVSEAMAALGVPTTRALAAVVTGEQVVREDLLPGAILTRVAASHIRVGSFQFFAARDDAEGIRLLAEHVIARHYPLAASAPNPFQALLDAVIGAQAYLVARWLLVGFIHGVMNTDNCSLAGETIDYGPCAFMDEYDPATVFSSIDRDARYAYGNQPRIAQWNLARLAETLLPLLDADPDAALAEAERLIGGFRPRFEAHYLAGLRRKIGLRTERRDDYALVQDLLSAMAAGRADFTLTFRALAEVLTPGGNDAVRGLFLDPTAFDAWAERWRARLALEREHDDDRRAAMTAVNPAYIPRNHLVEAMIRAAVDRQDFAPFEEMMQVLATPFVEQPAFARYAEPPQPDQRVLQTFCGT